MVSDGCANRTMGLRNPRALRLCGIYKQVLTGRYTLPADTDPRPQSLHEALPGRSGSSLHGKPFASWPCGSLWPRLVHSSDSSLLPGAFQSRFPLSSAPSHPRHLYLNFLLYPLPFSLTGTTDSETKRWTCLQGLGQPIERNRGRTPLSTSCPCHQTCMTVFIDAEYYGIDPAS